MSSTAVEWSRGKGRQSSLLLQRCWNVSTKQCERSMLHCLPSHTWRWWDRWKGKKECRRRGVTESRSRSPPRPPTASPPPPPPLRIKSGAIKCKSGQTAPPQLVGEFVLKWKWGWWRTWRLALRLTWKERKRQLLIFSFDLWLPLVFHTNADLWRSLTAHCYWRDYRKRRRERRGKRKRIWPQGLTVSQFIHFIFLFLSLSFLLNMSFSSLPYLFVDFPLFLRRSALVDFQFFIFFHFYLYSVSVCICPSFCPSTASCALSISTIYSILGVQYVWDSSLLCHTLLR